MASAATPNIDVWNVFMLFPRLALDSRALVQVPVGIDAHVGQKVRDGLAGVSRLGEALLAETVVHAPLQRVHQAAGHAVTGPALECAYRIDLGRKVRQVLRTYAFVVLAVAGGAGKIPGSGAVIEN